jgi:hypothetical protein
MIRRLALILALLLAAPLMAHQQKITISTITINPRTARIELVHQVPVHDAEHALRRQGSEAPDIVGSVASREAFARYVQRRFLLEIDGHPASPAYVGSEISGGNVMVYQEVPAPAGGVNLRVNSQILTDVWLRQENRVNIGTGAALTTLVFGAGDTPLEAVLKP